MKFSFLTRINLFFLLLVLVIPSFSSLIRPGFFPMQDDLQAFRLFEMDKCFQDFQIPCRWVPDAGYSYGYPQFEYYPPSVYYLGELIHLLGIQFVDVVKILFILGYLFSAITMYLFLKEVLGKLPAFFGALLYSYIPYKAVEVYVRGAMSEFWSLVFYPLIFWAIYKLLKKPVAINIGWLGLATGLLLTTHNLMTIIFIPAALIWAIGLILVEKKYFKFIHLFLGGLLGLGLAAFFTLPVLVERPYAHLESLLGGYFDYRQHFVDLNQLFFLNNFGYGSSVLGPGDDLSLSTGIIQWILGLAGVICSIVFYRKNKKLSIVVLLIALVELGVLFLMHQKSSFIWEKLPFLWYLQFPWRFLGVSIFLLSFLSAVTVYYLEGKIRFLKVLVFLIICLTFILYGDFFRPQSWLNISDKEKFSGISWQKQLTISIFDYLPIYAKLPPPSEAPKYPEIMDGKAQIINYQKGSDFQTGQIIVQSKANIRLPLFDFPGMKVLDNGHEIMHWHDDCRNQKYCLGLISFNLETGSHKIEAKLTNTPIRNIGNILSAITIILLIILFFSNKKSWLKT